jgi:hypothetical protein
MPTREGRTVRRRSNSPTVPVSFQFAKGENAKWECMTEFLVLRWPRQLP